MSETDMKIEKAAENTVARFVVQLVTPILLGIVAFLGQRQLGGIEESQASITRKQEEQAAQMAAIASDVRNLNTLVDMVALRRLDDLDKRVERLEETRKSK
jgi:hypothetical protein